MQLLRYFHHTFRVLGRASDTASPARTFTGGYIGTLSRRRKVNVRLICCVSGAGSQGSWKGSIQAQQAIEIGNMYEFI